MGVPKFFRYMAERYPCLLERVKEYQIPEFDNLYLDMNGIIHMCSHPDDYDPHFRISEEKIFFDIFHYIEILFSMIKPQRVFFMAIDGVAPRAKMNQQRGRRFRTAKEAEKLEAKAKDKGEVLPEVSRFDSNCITPGTVFMAKLHQQLKYFVVKKITQDKLWRKCKIILSGPETPGEGEHKIMDYIRYTRAQPGYDPNTRHCLYGLDADLIMLGLCTHEPHFSLLREEVRFGKKNSKRKSAPEAITFYLLHLSLMREYLEMEFLPIKNTLPFEYNMENIIDDWILMGFLVGNDFIPHLPNLHINKGALPVLYTAYMKVLPSLEGYINESGKLNLERFEKFMAALCNIDLECFSEQYADLKYFESKTGRRPNDQERTSYKPKALVEWDFVAGEDFQLSESLENNVPNFTKSERIDSGSNWSTTFEKPPVKQLNSDLAALIQATDDMILEPSKSNLEDLALEHDYEDIDGESDILSESSEDEDSDLFEAEFKQHKKDYYRNKLEYTNVTSEVMRNQAEGYVRAIQWNLNYYYNGVCSWSWYYPHHYSPFISDIKDFKDLKLEFDLAKPFQPYEQLLAVLPAASKGLLPECYHELMTDDNSLIKDYYPQDFETDLNGKRQDWEAVVLIPFIDEKKLLEAMAPRNKVLTPDEIERNTHGPMLVYEYTENDLGDYEAPEYFKNIKNHHAMCTLLSTDDIRVPVEKLVKGAYPGVKMDVYYPGFPTFKHLNYTAKLDKAKVKVFDQPSRDENMIIRVVPSKFDPIETLATQLLDTVVYVGWPHLVEGIVCALSYKNTRYKGTGTPGHYNVEETRGNVGQNWETEKIAIVDYYKEHLGIDVGHTDTVVHVKVITGRKYIFTKQGRVNLEKQWAEFTSSYPLQTIVRNISMHDDNHNLYRDVEDVFPINSTCFMLGQPHYGHMGTVMDSKESLLKGRVKVSLCVQEEPDFEEAQKLQTNVKYMSLHTAVGNLGISKLLFTKITGAVFIIMGPRNHVVEEDASKLNIGLNLKFNKKNEEVPGYTKKEHMWLYSQKTVDLVGEYMDTFPKLFEFIGKRMNNDMFFEYDIFPEDEGSGKSVREIVDWLKKQAYYSIDRKVCGSETLDPDVIKEMERTVDEHIKEDKAKNVTMQIKPHLLFQPDLQIGSLPPDPATTYYLYDRVVNVRDSFTVPLGYAGSVIAIHKPQSQKPEDFMYDVLFDKPFDGGLSLNCSQGRGYRMSRTALINRSYGARHLEEKTGKSGHLIQQLTGANLHKMPIQPPPQRNPNQQHIFIQPHHQQQPILHNPQQLQQLHQQSHEAMRLQMQQQQIEQRQNFRMPYYHPQNSAFASWNLPMPNNFPCPVPMNAGFQMANFPIPNQPRQIPMIPPVLEQKKIDFMPNFIQNKPEEPIVIAKPQHLQLNIKPVESKKEQNVENEQIKSETANQVESTDANVLKKILKINEEPVKQEEQKAETTPLSVQDIFAYASARMVKPPNASSLPPPPVVTSSCSLKLLSYYQVQGLGCPHYKYFDAPNGTHCQAQLTLPSTGEVVFGEPALSKELACESVARVVLTKLNIKDGETPPATIPWFPSPPKQWCESDKTKSNKQNKNKQPQHKQQHSQKQHAQQEQPQHHKQNQKQTKKDGESGDVSSKTSSQKSHFVPLQAVKQQRIHKTSVSNDNVDQGNNGKTENSHKEKKTDSQSIPTKNSSPETKTTKPRRERKMRIAANFSSPKAP